MLSSIEFSFSTVACIMIFTLLFISILDSPGRIRTVSSANTTHLETCNVYSLHQRRECVKLSILRLSGWSLTGEARAPEPKTFARTDLEPGRLQPCPQAISCFEGAKAYKPVE